ncbi:hypothetical protein NQ176_g4847 [Zarea fungicola]|uniref:Uncharacterized protein n=1 Tax=Zarea fungicola TaxID=93591 RepID=A0ACC1NDV0_9HYPO|nr:hypothetical protein NQ176_g4847 [Lecanicillium fungicola]
MTDTLTILPNPDPVTQQMPSRTRIPLTCEYCRGHRVRCDGPGFDDECNNCRVWKELMKFMKEHTKVTKDLEEQFETLVHERDFAKKQVETLTHERDFAQKQVETLMRDREEQAKEQNWALESTTKQFEALIHEQNQKHESARLEIGALTRERDYALLKLSRFTGQLSKTM